MFNQMLLHRNDAVCPAKNFYTYEAFIAVAKSFGGFGTIGDTATRLSEIATFFAQTSHETTGVNLLNNPYLVASDPVVLFKTTLWFWMTPHSPKPSCHDVISCRWTPTAADRLASRVLGFGVITNIITGGIERGHVSDPSVQDRIGFFKRYCQVLGVSPGNNLDCANQRSFVFGNV
ncbi:hypothetical protein ACSBR1_020243 [Camellia fascicularis]